MIEVISNAGPTFKYGWFISLDGISISIARLYLSSLSSNGTTQNMNAVFGESVLQLKAPNLFFQGIKRSSGFLMAAKTSCET